jgi:hypothetical protein
MCLESLLFGHQFLSNHFGHTSKVLLSGSYWPPDVLRAAGVKNLFLEPKSRYATNFAQMRDDGALIGSFGDLSIHTP